MPKITKTLCERASAPENKHHAVLWDGGHERAVKGYGLRVTARGAKSFIVSGRVRGKQLQFTIGSFGQFTEAEARAKARSVLQGTSAGCLRRCTPPCRRTGTAAPSRNRSSG